MSPKDDAMTALIPKSLNAHTACSLEDPQPKLSLDKSILAASKGLIFSINSSFIILSSFVMPSFPSS